MTRNWSLHRLSQFRETLYIIVVTVYITVYRDESALSVLLQYSINLHLSVFPSVFYCSAGLAEAQYYQY